MSDPTLTDQRELMRRLNVKEAVARSIMERVPKVRFPGDRAACRKCSHIEREWCIRYEACARRVRAEWWWERRRGFRDWRTKFGPRKERPTPHGEGSAKK